MKKLVMVIALIMIAVIMTGCNNGEENIQENSKRTVFYEKRLIEDVMCKIVVYECVYEGEVYYEVVTTAEETIAYDNTCDQGMNEADNNEEPYVSKEFLETLEANSRKNIYFGEVGE